MELEAGVRETISAHCERRAIEAALDDHELRLRLITNSESGFGTDRLLTAEVKRFAELLAGCPAFREALQEDARATIEAFGPRLDPFEARALRDSQALREGCLTAHDPRRDGSLVHAGLWNADAITVASRGEFGVAEAQACGLLNPLFRQGRPERTRGRAAGDFKTKSLWAGAG